MAFLAPERPLRPFTVKLGVATDGKPQAISEIAFGMFSGEEMVRNSHMQVVSNHLYEMTTRKPSAWGVLDPRLGESGAMEAVGHFGHVALALPVFHLGFFKETIANLQCVCKRCARVLLHPSQAKIFLRRMRHPTVDALRKVRIRKRIIEECKKVVVCPHCGAINGVVKRVPGAPSLRIVHAINFAKDDSAVVRDERRELSRFARAEMPELAGVVEKAAVVLTPLDAYHILRRVPDDECDLLWADARRGRPERLIQTHLQIPPVCIRPSVVMDVGGSNEDDLTIKLRDIVAVNNILQNGLLKGSAPKSVAETWDLLQLEVSAYLNGELPNFPASVKSKRPIRGLCQRLKGKQGRFRGNLSGKRVDFSGRTVISPDPNLPLFCVGVPERVARILTFPVRVTDSNIATMRELVSRGPEYPGANYVRCPDMKGPDGREVVKSLKFFNRDKIAESLRVGDIVERHLQDDDVVLFNRQPSLHKMSIMCHRVRVHEWRTFRFNECDCAPYNADFDGDEMNLHLPQTEEARAEAALLMQVTYNLITSRSGEPLIAATQDFITSAFLITQRNVFLTRDEFCQALATLGTNQEQVVIPTPAILKPVPLWTGKQVFNAILRPNGRADPVAVTCEMKANNYSGKRPTPTDPAQLANPGPGPGFGQDWKHMCPEEGWVCFWRGELMCGNVDKSVIGGKKTGLVYALIRDHGPEVAAECLFRLTRMGTRWLMNWGFSIGIEDVAPPAEIVSQRNKILQDGYKESDRLIRLFRDGQYPLKPGCNEEQSLESDLNGLLSKLRDALGDMCMKRLPPSNSPAIMATCGSKGSNINISQMMACVGQQSVGGQRIVEGFVDRTLPIFGFKSKEPAAKGFVANSFYSGLTASEFFFHTMGGREGLVDTAVKTAETGYMQRRMMKALEDLSVQYDGTVRNSAGDVVQFAYGDDGLDPSAMEHNSKPVDFDRLFQNVLQDLVYADADPLSPEEILQVGEAILLSPAWLALRGVSAATIPTPGSTPEGRASADASARPGTAIAAAQAASSSPDLDDVGGSARNSASLRGGRQFFDDTWAFLRSLSESVRSLRTKLGLTSRHESEHLRLTRKAEAEFTPSERQAWLEGTLALQVLPADQYYGEMLCWNAMRVTRAHVQLAMERALRKFYKATIQPGEAVGAVAAHSMGEPATQMTLKTFHFAGVASMNVTLGVPRIKEIMNASREISTPIIEAPLEIRDSEPAARVVKGRIEKTTLGQIARSITEVYSPSGAYILVQLDLEAIHALQLEIDGHSVVQAIMKTSKLKLVEGQVELVRADIIHVRQARAGAKGTTSRRRSAAATAAIAAVHGGSDVHRVMWQRNLQFFALQALKQNLTEVIVQGVPTVSRAVIVEDEDATKKVGRRIFKVLVEGYDLLKVMGTPGVSGAAARTNNIIELKETLGIEAARVVIMSELQRTYAQYGINIDGRHLKLLADVMTYRGEVLGITRFGIAKMKDSVLMLASFERTPDHLFDAAVHARQDSVRGVSECIVLGRPCSLGTGAFQVLHAPTAIDSGVTVDGSHSESKASHEESRLASDDGVAPSKRPASSGPHSRFLLHPTVADLKHPLLPDVGTPLLLRLQQDDAARKKGLRGDLTPALDSINHLTGGSGVRALEASGAATSGATESKSAVISRHGKAAGSATASASSSTSTSASEGASSTAKFDAGAPVGRGLVGSASAGGRRANSGRGAATILASIASATDDSKAEEKPAVDPGAAPTTTSTSTRRKRGT